MLIFSLVSTITFTPVASTYAERNEPLVSNDISNQTEQMNNPSVTNVITSGSSSSFTIIDDSQQIDFEINKINESLFEVNTITNKNEHHTLTYNEGENFNTLDGEQIEIQTTSIYDTTLAGDTGTRMLLSATNPWTPKYLATYQNNINKSFSTVGQIATVIGGFIGAGVLIGSLLATSTIASTVSSWVGVAGLGAALLSRTSYDCF